MNKSSGAPRSTFVVSGTGYGATEIVHVAFDGAVAANPTTAADGSFSASLTAPANAIPGGHPVTATGQASGVSLSAVYTVQTQWLQLLGSPAGRNNTVENVLAPANVAGLSTDWTATTGGAVTSSPAVQLGKVIIGSADGTLRAINAASGRVVWTATTGGPITSSPAVLAGVAYIGSADGSVYAYAVNTGSLKWKATTGGPVSSSAMVSSGVVYIGSGDGYLYAFAAATGALIWKAQTGATVTSSPNKVGNTVYVGSGNGKLDAFNVGNGTLRWTVATGAAITSSPDVAGNLVYVGSNDTKLYAVNALTGAVAWTVTTGGAVASTPAIANGVVYVGSNDAKLYAVNAATGTITWTAMTGGPVASSAAVANGVVYIGSGDRKVYAFPTACASTCSPLWSATTGGVVRSSPAVTDGIVYVGSGDAKLYAFAPSTGAPVDSAAYLGGPAHSSYNPAATTITPQNAVAMVRSWQWIADAPPLPQLSAGLFSSPVVYHHHIYFGSNNGSFYALDDRTGALLWKHFIGYITGTTCGSRGFLATATVAPDPSTGVLTVYVAAPDGYLYALRAADGATLWRSVIAIPSTTQNDYFDWSSPTVANGRIYVGIASQCDEPLVRGGLKEYDQGSGAELAAYWAVPAGLTGGTIWSAAAVAPDGTVFVTTGNQATGAPLNQFGDSLSIVKLDGQTLAKQGMYTVPHTQQCGDCDFGGSPTLFTANLNGTPTAMVGACNKNGYYYAVRQSDLSLVWTFHVGVGSTLVDNEQCDAAAIFDGTHLFIGGDATTIGGVAYGGSLRELNPATGAPIWQTGLPASILGSPALDGSGVIAAASYDYAGPVNSGYLINAATGELLATLSTLKSSAFPQPIFADNLLLLGTTVKGLFAYRPAH